MKGVTLCFFIVWNCCLHTGSAATNDVDICSDDQSEARVYLTVNALIRKSWGKTSARRIELNWVPPKDVNLSSDWIGFYKWKPTLSNKTKLLHSIRMSVDTRGYYLTNQEVPHSQLLTRRSPAAYCVFGYWIAYMRSDKILKMNCLKIRPTWMWSMRDTIGDLPLSKLMIPGTHNSGTYQSNNPAGNSFVERFTVAQSENIWNQLVYGARFLDIRAGYDQHTPEKFWIMHDFISMNPIYEVVQDVKKFLLATNEIVIMDFHRFPTGFESANAHEELLLYLFAELGDFMAPDWLGWTVTPNELWKRNRTLIVSYSHDPTSAFNGQIWSEVNHLWANKARVSELKSYLDSAIRLWKHSDHAWAAMTHLTPSQIDVILKPNFGIREMTDNVARHISHWYRNDWWDSVNVVATDFFLSNNLIEDAIVINRKRKLCSSL